VSKFENAERETLAAEISTKVGFFKELRIVFVGAMKLNEVEQIYRLLRDKDSQKHKKRTATH
jgi:hypothetical protein